MAKLKTSAGGGKGFSLGGSRVVAFRLPTDDYIKYREKFEASGLSQSAFFREYVLTNRTQVVARQKASVDKQRLLYLFNKASNNINQLAHRANGAHMEGKVSESTYISLLSELQQLTRFLKGSLNGVD